MFYSCAVDNIIKVWDWKDGTLALNLALALTLTLDPHPNPNPDPNPNPNPNAGLRAVEGPRGGGRDGAQVHQPQRRG